MIWYYLSGVLSGVGAWTVVHLSAGVAALRRTGCDCECYCGRDSTYRGGYTIMSSRTNEDEDEEKA